MGPSPLLEFFRRGEAPRDVRLAVAQAAVAPCAHEQLGLLVHLLEDQDPEIREAADQTLGRIDRDRLRRFLARSDVPSSLRDFFGGRGIMPADAPGAESDDPLVEAAGSGDREDWEALGAGADSGGEGAPSEDGMAGERDAAPAAGRDADRQSVTQLLARMNFSERLKAAMKGSREMRAILVRDPNKMIAAAVLSSPKLTEPEIEGIARMANVSDEVLRIIGSNRAWTKNYSIVLGLTKNPKTPIAMSLNLMSRLTDRDLNQLSIDRNVPDPLRIAARRRIVAGAKR